MARESEIFYKSGPVHLTEIDWDNPDHQRSVAASLVQGAYTVERDRMENRSEQNALAPPWWEFFGFQLNKTLVDPKDQSVFGCIYQLKNPKTNSPKFVVAFRGTIISRKEDLKLDLKVVMKCLHGSQRFQFGLQCVQTLISETDCLDIWIAGHSLGAAIALLVGRDMVELGFHLKTYVFNPPCTSLPFKLIKNKKLKTVVRSAISIIKAGVAALSIVAGNRDRHRDFDALSAWIPNLFVNPGDPIGWEYIGHFEHREKMVELTGVRIANLAAQNPVDAFDILPSAYVTTNVSSFRDYFKQKHDLQQWWRDYFKQKHGLQQWFWDYFKQKHGLQQWWSKDINLEVKLYSYSLL